MSENNNTTTNNVEQYKREMKKCDKNIEICVGSTAGLAAAGLLLSFVFPIAGIALVGMAIMPEGMMVHQVYKRNKNKKKVEAEKKKGSDAETNSIFKNNQKNKEQVKEKNININFLNQKKSDQNSDKSKSNSDNIGITNVSQAASDNLSSGVSDKQTKQEIILFVNK
ncbi:MAG: hypothetical protein IJT14_03930 [Rickettsiales bacterium]|nr:hypothetical protein [Rickettsiales bacterium]